MRKRADHPAARADKECLAAWHAPDDEHRYFAPHGDSKRVGKRAVVGEALEAGNRFDLTGDCPTRHAQEARPSSPPARPVPAPGARASRRARRACEPRIPMYRARRRTLPGRSTASRRPTASERPDGVSRRMSGTLPRTETGATSVVVLRRAAATPSHFAAAVPSPTAAEARAARGNCTSCSSSIPNRSRTRRRDSAINAMQSADVAPPAFSRSSRGVARRALHRSGGP